ncbi:hypothetical protein ACFE04_005420 [Oxalis oulophora]
MATKTTSVKTIEDALKLVDSKKESLKKAYDELSQCHSSLSQSLIWSDIDSYFVSIQNSLTQKLHLLQNHELTHQDNPSSSSAPSLPVPDSDNSPDVVVDGGCISTSQPQITPSHDRVNSVDLDVAKVDPDDPPCSSNQQQQPDSVAVSNTNEQELVNLCKNCDVDGLLKCIINRLDINVSKTRNDLLLALPAASDPAAMVYDAMPAFLKGKKISKNSRAVDMRGRGYVMLLEVLSEIGASLSEGVKESAKKLALEVKSAFQFTSPKSSWEALVFLQFLVAFKLVNEFEKGELVDFFLFSPKYTGVVQLCKSIDLGDSAHDLIKKLRDSGKVMLAVKFICGLGLCHTHPPVPLLKAYLDENSINPSNSQNMALRELNAYKAVIRVVRDCNLESDYPLESLQNHVDQLELGKEPKQKQREPQQKPMKRKIKQQLKKQIGNKRGNTMAHVGPTPRGVPLQQPYLQPMGPAQRSILLAGHGVVGGAAPILNTGYVTAAAAHAGALSSLYSEQYVPSAYGSVPQYQYHPSYYPQ